MAWFSDEDDSEENKVLRLHKRGYKTSLNLTARANAPKDDKRKKKKDFKGSDS